MSGRQVRAQYESEFTCSENGVVIGGSPFAKSGQSLSDTSPPSALPFVLMRLRSVYKWRQLSRSETLPYQKISGYLVPNGSTM
jgi:hypothetical protein